MNTPIKRTSTLAIVSLVSGLLGWTLLPWLGSLAAIITGHMARAEIRREAETVEGDGLAIGGLVLGYTMVALSLLIILLIVLMFGGLAVFLAWMGASGNLN
jgi:hypothetical protein